MDRKMEMKRLGIYLFFAFGLAWSLFIGYALTGHKWDGENPYLETFVGLGMFVPLLAHVITRFLTREGFALTGKDSMMFGISFKDRKWMYYLFAVFAPWLYFELGFGIVILAIPSGFDLEAYKELGVSLRMILLSPVICMISGVVASSAALGEEGGWRGYMMPKLIRLMGLKKAVVVGGILWGLWHAPLTCIGHNFGTDYQGFPFWGILIMCLECTFMGMMLTFVTVRTNSIWPAAFMHAVNNQNPCILKFFMDEAAVKRLEPFPLFTYAGLLIPDIFIGCICLGMLLGEKKEVANDT